MPTASSGGKKSKSMEYYMTFLVDLRRTGVPNDVEGATGPEVGFDRVGVSLIHCFTTTRSNSGQQQQQEGDGGEAAKERNALEAEVAMLERMDDEDDAMDEF